MCAGVCIVYLDHPPLPPPKLLYPFSLSAVHIAAAGRGGPKGISKPKDAILRHFTRFIIQILPFSLPSFAISAP